MITTTIARESRVAPHPQVGLAAAWLLAVAAMLLPERYLWLRSVGWAFAAYRIWKNPDEGLLLLAFFTPLFNNFGVVPIGFSLRPVELPSGPNQHVLSLIFFSIKPVQIITLLLIVSLSLRKRLFFKDPLDWLVVGSLIGIFAISLVAGAYSEDPLKAFRVNLNFALCIVLCKVLMSMIERREQFWRLLRFYFLGVAFLCAVHLANYFGGLTLFGQETRFNNHFGFLLSMSYPLGLCLLILSGDARRKAIFFGLLLLAFFCTVLTLSRSSLYGSLIGIAIFLSTYLLRAPKDERVKALRWLGMAAILVAVPVSVYEVIMRDNEALSLFRGKLVSFFKLFDPDYWRYAIFVDPNGGMFGERFVQLRYVKQIFLQHWLFGEGWTNRVISFHGLAYTMLTGTGLAGFSLFVYFLYRMFRALWQMSKRDPDPATKVLGIALFCALVDWMMHSLLDTYFLQFHIWLVLAMSLSYLKLVRAG